LEEGIDFIANEIELPKSFIIPGASPASGALDVARTLIRRTEREVVKLNVAGHLENSELLRYLNRLADFAFMLARYEDRDLPFEALTGGQS
jgi:cob(I)alamin adenosyltransferase